MAPLTRPTLAALAVLVAACSGPPQPPIERTRGVAIGAQEAARRAGEALARLGFRLDRVGPTRIEAERVAGADARWADCAGVWVKDYDSTAVRGDLARPQARRARTTVTALPRPQGSEVTVSAGFTASYLDRYRNSGFERPCPSSGMLERLVLDAVISP